MKKYNAIEISNYILNTYGIDSKINPMKLNKLIYLSNEWYIKLFKSSLINDEVEAWKYGPIIPSVYFKYKDFGINYINIFSISTISDSNIKQFLDKIWEVYGQYTAIELSAKVNHKLSPWNNIYESNSSQINYITEDYIKDYYKVK